MAGQYQRYSRKIDSVEGVDFARCRICGDHRRAISARYLSKHGTERETYMEEYGLSLDELIAKDFQRIQSSRRGYHPYGKKDWIAAIKTIHKGGGSVFAGDLQNKHPYLYQQGIWIFRNWNKALRAARFNPERMRMRRFWYRGRVVKQIRRLRIQNLPLSAKNVMKNHGALFSGGVRRFGSWNKALLAAGITNKEITRKTRLGLLRELRDAMESGGVVSQKLRAEIAHYFGSLRNAKVALKTDARLLSGWSKRKIITIFTQMHRSKKKPDYGTGRRDFPALVSAADAYFGSWGKALNAAGTDPNLYFLHHKWRGPQTGLRRV